MRYEDLTPEQARAARAMSEIYAISLDEAAERVIEEAGNEQPEPGELAITYDELLADREQLDRVVKAISLEENVDYVEAIERLEDWHSQAAEHRSEPPTLAQALDAGFVDAGQVKRNLDEISRRRVRAEERLTLDRGLKVESDDVQVDDRGSVKLTSLDDGARLVSDPIAQERAYLEALEMGAAEPGDEGRREFMDQLRAHAEAGLDLIATLRRREHEDERDRVRRDADDAVARWVEGERRRRAERRSAEADVDDAVEKLRRAL